MATLLSPPRTNADPLSETYFVRAAGALDTHRAGSGHVCVFCTSSWPCAPAQAAAFVLELHAA